MSEAIEFVPPVKEEPVKAAPKEEFVELVAEVKQPTIEERVAALEKNLGEIVKHLEGSFGLKVGG